MTKCYQNRYRLSDGSNLLGFAMRYGTNKEKHTVRGGVMLTGKGEPWHTKEEVLL